ncbi:M56 family metallopeptidase [Ammoniphilus sp. YIM 78166]|uniref:M56 family metallopeptidase n=1 Tax=Ammoniphilus sp. YIM 78166 TaxID=1644106 RepID=UPI00106FF2C6|nr:M56 family metallopeptidase [Ammoniphilus sp. YIM 78166]
MWKQQSIFIAGFSMVIAAFVWSQMGLYLMHLFFGVAIPMNLFEFCVSLFKEATLYYFIVIYALNTIIAYTGLIALIKIVQQFFLYRKFKLKILSLKNQELSKLINHKFNRQDEDIIVVNHQQSLAFSMGFKTPLIVLSSGLINILDQQEIEAVVHHETYHQKNYDSLKTFVLQVIAYSLWYIPLTKWCYQNYKIISELSADEYAIQKMGSEIGLGSALIKLIKNCFSVPTAPVIVHFSDESVNYRLKQLVSPKKTIPLKLDTRSIVASIYVLILLMSMIVVGVA